MRYRQLGKYGVRISEIGLGSWLTYGGSVEDRAAIDCIHRAFELGVNFFDTANVYRRGAAEEVTGRALKDFRRDDYVLATKVYFPMGEGPNDRGLSRKHIMEQCHASLRRLGVDYVDLYQCHRPDPDAPLEETLRALDDLVTQGRVLYVGVSQWSAELLDEARRIQEKLNLDPIVSNQPEYSLLARDIEDDVLPTSRQLGIGQVVWSPIAQRVLAGKYNRGERSRARRGDAAADRRRSRARLLNGGRFLARDEARERREDEEEPADGEGDGEDDRDERARFARRALLGRPPADEPEDDPEDRRERHGGKNWGRRHGPGQPRCHPP